MTFLKKEVNVVKYTEFRGENMVIVQHVSKKFKKCIGYLKV